MAVNDLDMGSAPRRARQTVKEFLTSLRGIVAQAFFGGVGTFLATQEQPSQWTTAQKAAVSAAGAVAGVAVVIVVVFLASVVLAPKWQRDDARRRLTSIQAARNTYSIVPVRAKTAPVDPGQHLQCEIRNEGRGAQFSVVLESLDGLDEPLIDPHLNVYWCDRPGVAVEEIPPGEGRLIGVAVIMPAHVGYSLHPMSVNGPRSDGRRYHFEDGPREITAWLRVSARNSPEIYYSRRFGVRITWPGPGHDYDVSLAEAQEGDEEQGFTPILERLLDF